MKVSRDFEAVRDDEPVIVFAQYAGKVTATTARLHWFEEKAGDQSTTRRQAWQSTWDGSELPKEWRIYAWAEIEYPDPDHEPESVGDVI